MSALHQLLASLSNAAGSTAAGVLDLFAFWLGGAGAPGFVRFGTIQSANVVESGTGPYTYTLSGGAGGTHLTVANLKFPAGVAASMTIKRTALPSGGVGDDFMQLAFNPDNTTVMNVPTTPTQGGVCTQGAFDYYPFKSGSFGSDSGISATTNTYARIRRDASNILYFEASPDNVTWTTMDTQTGANVDYWPQMAMASASSLGAAWQLYSQTGMV